MINGKSRRCNCKSAEPCDWRLSASANKIAYMKVVNFAGDLGW